MTNDWYLLDYPQNLNFYSPGLHPTRNLFRHNIYMFMRNELTGIIHKFGALIIQTINRQPS